MFVVPPRHRRPTSLRSPTPPTPLRSPSPPTPHKEENLILEIREEDLSPSTGSPRPSTSSFFPWKTRPDKNKSVYCEVPGEISTNRRQAITKTNSQEVVDESSKQKVLRRPCFPPYETKLSEENSSSETLQCSPASSDEFLSSAGDSAPLSPRGRHHQHVEAAESAESQTGSDLQGQKVQAPRQKMSLWEAKVSV